MNFIKPVILSFFMSALIMQNVKAQIVFKKLSVPSLSLHDLSLRKMNLPPVISNATPITPLSIPPSCHVALVTCSVVPVTLLDFIAVRADDKTAIIKWVTEMESNLSGYFVERSLKAASGFYERNLSARVIYLQHRIICQMIRTILQ